MITISVELKVIIIWKVQKLPLRNIFQEPIITALHNIQIITPLRKTKDKPA
jgi:hypothetical protein